MELMELIFQTYTPAPTEQEPFPVPTMPEGDYPAIAARLNEPTEIPNPQATPVQVPAPITLKGLMSVVPASEMVAVYKELPAFVGDLKSAIDNQDREYMAGLLQIALAAQVIGAGTAAQLQAMLTATIDDPTWTPTVAGPSLAAQNGFGVITEFDVQKAMNIW